MSKRDLARVDTRRRIVEATVRLHGERGVFGTSWKDIASEADVSVATVYAHFPSLEALLPACGERVMDLVRPPKLDASDEAVGDSTELVDRLERVALELFGFYERGGPMIEVDVRERQLEGMREWEAYLLDLVTARVRAALGPRRGGAQAVRVVRALLDLPTFRALSGRGVAVSTAARTMARIAASLIDESGAAAVPVARENERPRSRGNG